MAEDRLTTLYTAMEVQARADGLTRADAEVHVGNRLHQWVEAHCRYEAWQAWYICFVLACRLGKTPKA